MVSIVDNLVEDFEGSQSAADYISKSILKDIFKKTLPDYFHFIQAKLVSDSVEKARKMALKAGVKRNEPSQNPFFVSDADMGVSGAIGNSFAFVKPGRENSPLRIIVAHSDVPSLRIPVNSICDVTTKEEFFTPSLCLLTEPFGGVRAEDWYGMEVDIVGKLFLEGKEKRIDLPGRIRQKSVHVDDSRLVKTFSGLKVDIGLRTLGDFYGRTGLTSTDDFARAKLYCLPHFNGKNGRMVGNELGAFGHDDRCCMWAALRAGLESLDSKKYTTLVFGLDNEEIGSVGISANYKGFFESVLRETLKITYKSKFNDLVLPLDLNRGLLGDMPAIFADVGIGMGPEELDDPLMVSHTGAGRLGGGPIISYNIKTSPKHTDKLITLLDNYLPDKPKHRHLRYQIGGDYTPIDRRYSASGDASMSDSFDSILPALDMGIAVSGLHHPRTEAINVFDLHWMKEAFKLYLKH